MCSILGWEDPLKKGMAPRSLILTWEIPWSEEPGGLQSMGLQRVGHDLVTVFLSPENLDAINCPNFKIVVSQGKGRP